MKNLAIGCAVAVLFAGMVGSVSAGEFPKSTLASMGLSGVHQMSDEDGLAVRGMGGPDAWGLSISTSFSNSSINGYVAHGHTRAVGSGFSFAGTVTNHGLALTAAGGASGASK